MDYREGGLNPPKKFSQFAPMLCINFDNFISLWLFTNSTITVVYLIFVSIKLYCVLFIFTRAVINVFVAPTQLHSQN